MKFNLEIRNVNGSKRIIFPFLSTYPRSFGRVEAIIDTGSPITVLSASDSLRLNLPCQDSLETTLFKVWGILSIQKTSASQTLHFSARWHIVFLI